MTQIFFLQSMTYNIYTWYILFAKSFAFLLTFFFFCLQLFLIPEDGIYWCNRIWLLQLVLQMMISIKQLMSPACCMYLFRGVIYIHVTLNQKSMVWSVFPFLSQGLSRWKVGEYWYLYGQPFAYLVFFNLWNGCTYFMGCFIFVLEELTDIWAKIHCFSVGIKQENPCY